MDQNPPNLGQGTMDGAAGATGAAAAAGAAAAGAAGGAQPGATPAGKSNTFKCCAAGCVILVILGIIAVASGGMVLSIAIPNFQAARDVAHTRSCFANQRIIHGSIEMYNLDQSEGVQFLDAQLVDELLSIGYLQQYPECPAAPDASPPGPYRMIVLPGDVGGTVFCLHHGFFQPPEGATAQSSPREQLQAAGVTDRVLLNEASDEPLPDQL